MKLTTFVALTLLSAQCFATAADDAAKSVESEWASIYYTLPKTKQISAYEALLTKTTQLSDEFPESPDLKFWQAVILSSNAELQDGFTALKAIHKARDLLVETIKINPQTANGSAYVTLGTLYYMVPKWPIAFGDNEKAQEMFQTALRINPGSIDANYFYGDFLLANNRQQEAQQYFEKAIAAPSRKEQLFADDKLKDQVKLALANAKSRKINGVKNAFLSLFNSASLK
jgi:tetratricopeptide (TPR) repeat protein